MRVIINHETNPQTPHVSLCAMDEPGSGGACHRYRLIPIKQDAKLGLVPLTETVLQFQNGPVLENGVNGQGGVNGITNEALIAVLIDRLEGFQSGPYANIYNGDALASLKSALFALHSRTREREARGVEGTHKV